LAPSATLIFPAVNQLAADYWRAAQQRGERTVAAASVATDVSLFNGMAVVSLPTIYEKDFPAAFLALIAEHSIARIHCSVASVYAFLRQFCIKQRLTIELLGDSPIHQQMSQHQRLMARTRQLRPLVIACADVSKVLPELEIAAVFRQSALIYGESNDEKLAAMMGIVASAPAGDVVELGSLMGRTAFVLLYLSRRYCLGPLLTVDPWLPANAVHRDSPEAIRSLVDDWDYDALAEAFFVNLAPFVGSDHAHLRMPSAHAFPVYAEGYPILSQDARVVTYCRRIAILHIDANHDYDAVRNDCDLWLRRLLPGAWLILDDYVWSHGDGPRRVGNELIEEYAERIERAFVCGKALFMKFRGDANREE